MIPTIVPRPLHCSMGDGYHYARADALEQAVCRLDASFRHPESYRLTITADAIELEAGTQQGLFYGKKTLEQMLHAHQRRLPCCTISDKPAFSHRGFMIDCARHFFPAADLKKMIEAAALFKFNVFHWHLTDDQGWRIQSEAFPALAEKGSVRRHSNFGKYKEPDLQTGYYTREEIRDVVAFCAARHIRVIPEVDVPGHVSSVLAAYPALSCDGHPVQVQVRGGIYKDVLCPGKEEVYEFLEQLFDELMELFPGDTIHIGGDETPKSAWKACPDCQYRMKAEGLADGNALQGYFSNRLIAHLADKGRRAVLWNDALQGGNLRPDAAIQFWMNHPEQTALHANRGGQVIASDFYHCYLDYPYGQTPLRKVYSYDPYLPGMTQTGRENVLGVEAPIWTEYVLTRDRLAYLGWPRLAAVAEVGWTDQEKRDYGSFEQRLIPRLPMQDELVLTPAPTAHWNPSPHLRDVDLAIFWNKAINRETLKQWIRITR
ncbi:MAG: beta-N-acetylhexosaminidase [Clostridiales bacterium]|nr:beta-N-acetylhexosaminidase [Clostridiales bacterium]